MTRRSWDDLPDGVRHAVEVECGSVGSIIEATAGSTCDFASALDTASGRVFVKIAHEDSDGAWMVHNEAHIARWLPHVAPDLLWHVHAGAWLVNGYEYIEGRHADLSPGSADLPLVAKAFAHINECSVSGWQLFVQPIENRWRAHVDEQKLVAGSALLHTDPVASNLIVADGIVRVIDWGWPARGAPWIDTALLVVRLADAGHSFEDAEAWADNIPAWREVTPSSLTTFATVLAVMWADRARTRPASHRYRLADIARRWATWRHQF